MNQKVKQQIPEVSLVFKHTKKDEIWSFIRARIRIRSQTSGFGPFWSDPDHNTVCDVVYFIPNTLTDNEICSYIYIDVRTVLRSRIRIIWAEPEP
jgi:hypothetical protein